MDRSKAGKDQDERKARLAAELRANLQRRKSQVRARREGEAADHPPAQQEGDAEGRPAKGS